MDPAPDKAATDEMGTATSFAFVPGCPRVQGQCHRPTATADMLPCPKRSDDKDNSRGNSRQQELRLSVLHGRSSTGQGSPADGRRVMSLAPARCQRCVTVLRGEMPHGVATVSFFPDSFAWSIPAKRKRGIDDISTLTFVVLTQHDRTNAQSPIYWRRYSNGGHYRWI